MLTRFRLAAALSLTAAQGDAPPRFVMQAYDGGLLRLAGVPVPVVVDLAGIAQIDQVKALLHHNPSRPVGHMTRVVIGDRDIQTEGELSVPGPDRDLIVEAQRGGFAWEASIGATVDVSEKVPPGRSVEVNGRTFKGPLVVARKATLREVTFTGAGAGENTSAAIAATACPITESQMDEELNPTQQTEPSKEGASDDVTQLQALRAEIKADLDLLQKHRAELKAEADALSRERTAQSVETVAAQLGMSGHEILSDLKAKAAAGELKANEVELHLLRASRKQGLAGLAPLGGKSGAPATPHVIEAALCLTSGWNESTLGDHFDDKTIEASLGREFRGFGPKALMVEFLRAHGHHCIGGQLQDDDIRKALQLASDEPRSIRASGGFSTISLPGILSNHAKKELLRGYDAVDSAILKIARRASASDYKPFYMYRMTTNGLLEQVGADGELTSMTLAEEEYQSRVYPFGRKLAMTDVMFRNDDLGAFNDLARLFGVTTKRTTEKQGFTALLSQRDSFWTTGKKNRLSSGAGSALSLTSLADAYQLFLTLEDPTGEPIEIEPKYLLVAPRDKVLAVNIHTQQQLNLAAAGTTDATVERFAGNSFVGQFQPLHSARLGNNKVANANGTQWLLCADPAITSPIVAAFLDGREGPQIKTWEQIPGRLGMQWDISAVFGFNLHDDRGAVYSPGQ